MHFTIALELFHYHYFRSLAVGHSPNSQTNFPGCLVIALLRAQSFILDKTDRSAVAAIVVVHVHSARKEVEAPCVL